MERRKPEFLHRVMVDRCAAKYPGEKIAAFYGEYTKAEREASYYANINPDGTVWNIITRLETHKYNVDGYTYYIVRCKYDFDEGDKSAIGSETTLNGSRNHMLRQHTKLKILDKDEHDALLFTAQLRR